MISTLSLSSCTLLAWRPFLDPIQIHEQWPWLMLPLVLVISLVYRTLKLPTLDHLLRETIQLTLYIIIFMMALAGAVLWIIVEVV